MRVIPAGTEISVRTVGMRRPSSTAAGAKPFTPQVLSDTIRSALASTGGTRARSAIVRQQASVASEKQ